MPKLTPEDIAKNEQYNANHAKSAVRKEALMQLLPFVEDGDEQLNALVLARVLAQRIENGMRAMLAPR